MNEPPIIHSPPPPQRRSLWKPIAITLLVTSLLSFSACAGSLLFHRNSIGSRMIAHALLVVGMLSLAVFVLLFLVAVIYLFVWIFDQARPK
ncbi:MAG: hypothetical protein WAK20_01260 [Candidatus Acidiferrum sp.]